MAPAQTTSRNQRILRKISLSPLFASLRQHSEEENENFPEDTLTSTQVYAVHGQKLKTTKVFDLFWYFAAERTAIDDKRRRGLQAPWTDDPILSEYRFCNAFRVADRVSQYIIQEVIEKGSQEYEEIIFRVVLFNTFTKIETYELLQGQLGTLTWKDYRRKDYDRVLGEAKRSGATLYTGAFQKPAPNFKHADAFANHLDLLEILMNELPARIAKAKYLADIFEHIVSFQGMGDFNSYQLLLNLSYSNIFNFSESDFVALGLGARSGFKKCFGFTDPSIEAEVLRWMQKTQDEHFARLRLIFNGLGKDHLPLQLCDIEHTLCEVDKFSRGRYPSIKGTHNRSEIGPKFATTTSRLPPLCVPKAWDHPKRRILQIRPEKKVKVQKRYVVDKIVEHRQNGTQRMFRIHWLGYASSADTWEPEANLEEDAPEALAAYLKSL